MATPNNPLASFTMPDYDVTITPVWKPASLFNISDDGICSGFSDYYKSLGDAAPTDIEIPEGVKRISGFLTPLFKGTNITSLVLPKTLEKIGQKSFADCKSLRTIKFPTSRTNMVIELWAFNNCSSLESVEIPDGVDLGSNVFEGCTNLQSAVLPSTLSEFIGSLFRGCISLVSVNIPEGTKSIGADTFGNCTSLRDIRIPSAVETIHWYGFRGCADIRFTIDKPENSIADAPWGATNATINWLG